MQVKKRTKNCTVHTERVFGERNRRLDFSFWSFTHIELP
jgi:hypothetical protein